MNNFRKYLTPQQYWNEYHSQKDGFKNLEEVMRASKNNKICEVCDEKVWKLSNTGLCFSCVTGESDATEDYELI